jgi:hypothetical protein
VCALPQGADFFGFLPGVERAVLRKELDQVPEMRGGRDNSRRLPSRRRPGVRRPGVRPARIGSNGFRCAGRGCADRNDSPARHTSSGASHLASFQTPQRSELTSHDKPDDKPTVKSCRVTFRLAFAILVLSGCATAGPPWFG